MCVYVHMSVGVAVGVSALQPERVPTPLMAPRRPPTQVCDPGPCLFHLPTDPLEETNLAHSSDPQARLALARLRARLQSWHGTRVPNQAFPCDPASCPVHFGGVWMPWLNSTPPMPTPPPNTRSTVQSSSLWRHGNGFVQAQGWVCDKTVPSRSEDPVTVQLSMDGAPLGSTVANLLRPRLVNLSFCPDNYHGFVFNMSETVAGQGLHTFNFTLVTRATGTRLALTDSPQCLRQGKGVPCTTVLP